MKITYEFQCNIDEEDDDQYHLKIFQRASEMYHALLEIDEYLRELRKGWTNDDKEKIQEKIQEIVIESRIGEI